jgi:hypothetical protein
MLRVTDKSFQYTPSFETDLKKTFRKINREKREAALSAKASEATATGNSVVTLTARRIAQIG